MSQIELKMLQVLSDDVCISVFFEWVEFSGIGMLDCSFCNKKLRESYLALIKVGTFTPRLTSSYCHVNGCVKMVVTNDLLVWLALRQAKVDCLTIGVLVDDAKKNVLKINSSEVKDLCITYNSSLTLQEVKQVLAVCPRLRTLSIEEQPLSAESLLFSLEPQRLSRLTAITLCNLIKNQVAASVTDSFLSGVAKHCAALLFLLLRTNISLSLGAVSAVIQSCTHLVDLHIEPLHKVNSQCELHFHCCATGPHKSLHLSFPQDVCPQTTTQDLVDLFRSVRELRSVELGDICPYIITDCVINELTAQSSSTLDRLVLMDCSRLSMCSLETLTACSALISFEIQECDHLGIEDMMQLLLGLPAGVTSLAVYSELLDTSSVLRVMTAKPNLTQLTLLQTDILDVDVVRLEAGMQFPQLDINEYCREGDDEEEDDDSSSVMWLDFDNDDEIEEEEEEEEEEETLSDNSSSNEDEDDFHAANQWSDLPPLIVLDMRDGTVLW